MDSDLLNIGNEDWNLGPAHVNAMIAELIESNSDPLLTALVSGFDDLDTVMQVSLVDLRKYSNRIKNALPHDPPLAIGATKEMLEATMKTILDRRGNSELDKLNFPDLMSQCLRELGLSGDSRPITESERIARKIASGANKMLDAVNKFRNTAGTGHGKVVGKEPVVTSADANLVAYTGLLLAAWLLRHDSES